MAEQLVGKISTVQISDVLTEPLSLSQNLNPLLTLNDIVRTCYGPRGRLKLIQNKDGGTVVITSSSSILFHRISPSNPFVRLIFACVKSHLSKFNDFGLLTALIITTLLLSSLHLNVPKILVADVNDYIIKLCFEYFNSEQCPCKVRLRLDDVSQLLSVIRTVINSKPGCVLSKDEKNHLALLLLKAFLNVVPNTGKIMGRIEIITREGVNVLNSDVFCGLLIPCQSNTKAICDKNGKRNLKLLLFATSLSGDAKFCVDKLEVHGDVSVWNEVFCELNNLIAKIIENDIDIVACQMVIHPLLKERLESAGILVFDRLGADLSRALQELTRACPIETLLFPEDLNVVGNVTSIEMKKINKKTYVNLQSNDTMWTLLICHNIESALNETNFLFTCC
ncbi:McKusick-Kaufman/Bardet-Biedl syndromes putative chaperonin-like [Centruroides sculpturatus]|uniref:McKusick-Kaufman/Bardet-Biedl syndromes putative chaperonin-like n=1 Tax=Centruroides sculpturatus TaxID=218467 RepID=UPI000C6E1EF5|nr:McKusick-Kaufman/Bardet-Biedl syndromes putative chaperonin-like [Centruroides sculpturatus]